MREIDVQQGAPEWHAHRAKTRNASDAPAMMGVSPYVSRKELIRRLATGIEPVHDDATQKRFDDGHRVEPALRAYAERLIGEDLYQIVAVSDDGYLGASFDGVSMDEDVILEVKQSNAKKTADIERDVIPEVDYWQIVQQFAVCEKATTCIYAVGDGTDDATVHMVIDRARVEHDIPKLRAAWQQFDADLAAYQPEPVKAEVIGRAPESLPALRMDVSGTVVASNLDAWKTGALTIIRAIPRELHTDSDFANAKKTVKWCEEKESELKAGKAAALAQMESVDALFRAVDAVGEELRSTRLQLDKLVKAEEQNRRAEIAAKANREVSDFIATLSASLDVGLQILLPTNEIAAAMKGKSSLKSITDAVAQVVADAKIAASAEAERYRANIAAFERCGRLELFADRERLVREKQTDDLHNLIQSRIADADAREAARREAERARIRAEEEAKAKREAEAAAQREIEAERARIREEERQRAAIIKPQVSEAVPEVVAATPRADQASTTTASDAATASAPLTSAAAFPQQAGPAQAAPRPGEILPLIKLGDINARIAPLSISADGLAQLGFPAVSVERASKLYRETDFPAICIAIGKHLRAAMDAHTTKRAA